MSADLVFDCLKLSKQSSASVISRPSFISVAAQVQQGWRDEEESVGCDSAE